MWQPHDESPVVEVKVFRHGKLVHSELCESDEQANLVMDVWKELDGTSFEVDDLTVQHRQGDILGPEPSEPIDTGYPTASEMGDA